MQDYSIFASRERDGWADESISGAYVDGFGPVVDEAADIHLKAAKGARKVLDLCCGQGTLTARLVAAGHDVTGLDFSAAMLERAREAATGATLIEGDAQDMPFEDESFDVVVCNFGIMHLPDQPKGLSEVRRVLKAGGHFSMTSWVGPERPGVFQTVLATVRAHMPEGVTPPPAPDFFVYGRKDEAREVLASGGLDMTDHSIFDLSWPLSDAGDLFATFRDGTVGARMAILALDEDRRARAAAAIAARVEADHATGTGYSVPVGIAHITASRGA